MKELIFLEIKKVSEDDLKLINSFSKRELKSNEIYTFRLVCCDNQIDRDFEKFDDAALEKMAELYPGRTIIKDHDPKADNQSARIYKAEVIQENGIKKLLVYAYIPVLDSTKDFIETIETGLKKEVSVGCAVKKRICSICGSESYCSHSPGRTYNNKTCFKTLSDITDVYEISFVAVPAQKNAGVIKSFDVQKKLETQENQLEQELLEFELKLFEKEFYK